MGVKGLNSYIKKNFPSSLSSIFLNNFNNKRYTHLFLEINPMLHALTRKASYSLEAKIRRILKSISHLKENKESTTTFVMDGVAPLAKLEEQRDRRIRKVESSLRISVGTPFMLSVEKFINSLSMGSVNGTLNRGEGELKVFQALPPPSSILSNRIAIIGTDSDSYLFGLGRMINSPNDTIDILKGPWESMGGYELSVISINKIASIIVEPLKDKDRSQILADFLLILGIGGNDYLNGIPFYLRDFFWKFYGKKREIPFKLWNLKENSINLFEFKRYINSLSNDNPSLLFSSRPKSSLQSVNKDIAMWLYGITCSQRQILNPSKFPLLNSIFNKNCNIEFKDFITMDIASIQRDIDFLMQERMVNSLITPGVMSLIILPNNMHSKNLIPPVLVDIYRKYHHHTSLPHLSTESLKIDHNLINSMQKDIDSLNLKKGTLDYLRVYGND